MANDEYRDQHERDRAAGLAARHETRVERAASRLPEHLQGDGPCNTCGTRNNIVWFTESPFWNAVVRDNDPDMKDQILCIPCFVKLVDAKGYKTTGWLLTPEWHWETKDEAATRRLLTQIGSKEHSNQATEETE